VLKGIGNASTGAARFTSDKVRVIKRQTEVRLQESKPEGDAISNVQEEMERRLEQAPRMVYRLTRVQIRLIRRHVEKRKEAARLKIQAEQAHSPQPDAESGAPARASPGPSHEAVSTFDDPAKRPLSAREIAKGREHRRASRRDARKPIPAEKGDPSKPTPVSTEIPEAAKPRTRYEPARIQHERPAPKAPKPRESFRQPVKATQHVIERQPRQAVKTADAAARTAARQSANGAKKTAARTTDQAAKVAAKNAAKAAKHMADLARQAARRTADARRRASQAAIRASIQAMRALVNLLISGGWVIVLIILVLLMCVSILASPFGIFTHTDANEFPDSITLDKAITTINADYAAEIRRLGGGRSDTLVAIEGNLEGGVEPVNWVDVLAVFSVHLTMREENAMDVVQLDKAKVDELRKVFWDMNTLSTSTDTDEEGETTFYIEGSCRSYREMLEVYHFNEQQKQLIAELMSDEYYAFWSNFVSSSMGYGPEDWGGVVTIDDDYTPGMSGTVMKIPKAYQFDYKKTVCTIGGERKSVSTSGCGATSMSMVIRYLTGDSSQTPYTLFKWAYKEGYYSGDGLGHGAVSAMGKLYGVTGSWVGKDGKKIVAALSSGHPVIAHMGPGIFTKGGHYIVLRGVTEDGKILVNDPNSKPRSGKAYPLSTILKQAKTSPPFMICSLKSN
jgi:hypothetical protein